jgi:hypothetical protein
VIDPGEHPFVVHPTCAYDSDGRRPTAERLLELLEFGDAVRQETVGAMLLERLRAGFLVSPYTPNALRAMAIEVLGAAADSRTAKPCPRPIPTLRSGHRARPDWTKLCTFTRRKPYKDNALRDFHASSGVQNAVSAALTAPRQQCTFC